jgi:hypothetical protein
MSLLKEIACVQLRKEWKWINVPLEIEANVFEPDTHWASGSEVQVLRTA